MKHMHWAAALLALILLCAGLPAHAEAIRAIDLPGSLEEIEAEAFSGGSALQTVIVPEGTKRIGSRSFADSSLQYIYLPESIEYIAEDAFAGSDQAMLLVPRNSHAHRRAMELDVQYTVIEPDIDDEDAGFAIHKITLMQEEGGAYFLANVSAPEACLITLQLYPEEAPEGEPILSFSSPVQEETLHGDVKIIPADASAIPDYFIIKAFLTQEYDGTSAGEAFLSYEYTRRFEEAAGKTEADFEGQPVLSLGDAGYAVLKEGVYQEGEAVFEGGRYTLTPENVLSKGDVIMLSVNGKSRPVKIASVSENGDGSVTLQPDSSLTLSDAFEHLSVSGYMQPAGGVSAASDGENTVPLSFPVSIKDGPLTVSGEIVCTIGADLIYNDENEYFSIECWVKSEGSIDITLGAGFDTRDLDSPLKLTLLKVPLEIPKTDIGASFSVTLPFDLDAETGGSAYIGFTSKNGFTYNSLDRRIVKIDEKTSEAYAKVKGTVTVTTGPQIMLKTKLMELLDASVRAQIGIELSGNMTETEFGGSIGGAAPGEIHACDGCLDCDINLIAGLWATIDCEISKNLEINLFDKELMVFRGKIGDAYWSYLNDPDSPYGGEESFGFTECKNVMYRTSVSTENYKGEAVTGLPVSRTGKYGPDKTGISPCEMYLYPGKSSFTVAFETGSHTLSETIRPEAQALVLKEPYVTLTVNATDEDTGKPVKNASAVLTLPDGTRRQGFTDATGSHTFDRLPAGTYSLAFAADNYKPRTYSNLSYEPGYTAAFTAALEFDGEFPLISTEFVSPTDGWRQLKTGASDIPKGVPDVRIRVQENGTNDHAVFIKHSDCEKILRLDYPDRGFYFASAKGFDMGEHEYVFHLTVECGAPNAGIIDTIFRVENGAFKIVETFDTGDAALHTDVYAEGVFTSANELEGTMHPSGTKFKIITGKSNTSRIGTELYHTANGKVYRRINEKGASDLLYQKTHYYDTTKTYTFGTLFTLYTMKDGELVLSSQWYEPQSVDSLAPIE